MARYNRGARYNQGYFWNTPDGPVFIPYRRKGRRNMAGNPIPEKHNDIMAMAEEVSRKAAKSQSLICLHRRGRIPSMKRLARGRGWL